MAPKYTSDRVKLLLTLTVLLMFVTSTASKKQIISKKTKSDVYVIRNVDIKLCQSKCFEHGQSVSIEYDTETLTCRLSRDESKIKKKKGHFTLARSHSLVPTDSCTSGKCSFGQRCLKTRFGKEVCIQDIVPVSDSPTDASEDLTPSKTVLPALVTTQDSDPHATPSSATDHDLFHASKRGDLERVKRILAEGNVDINSRGPCNLTPVMAAAMRGHRNVLELLVGKGADVSLVDKYGYNVLHLASTGGHTETVKLILSLSVLDLNTRNNLGKTAAYYARRYRHQQVLDLLVSHLAH